MKQIVRQSNFELLRLIAMFMILALHANFFAIGRPSFADCLDNPCEAWIQCFLEIICIPSVDVFVLISGFFSIKPGVKNVSNLLFQYFFYSLGILLICEFLKINSLGILKTLAITFSFNNYWFLGSYLCLMFLAPFLNAYIEHSNKKDLLLWIVLFFIFQFCTDFFYALPEFKQGSSCLSFVGLYMLGRYIRLYGGKLFNFNKYGDLAIYLGISLASIILLVMPNEFLYGWCLSKFMSYNSPLVIISSIYLFLFFSKLNFSSKWVNHCGKSSFAIYLIHCHILLVYDYYTPLFKELSLSYSSHHFALIAFGAVCCVFVGCILLDQLRLLGWNVLQNKIVSSINRFLNLK